MKRRVRIYKYTCDDCGWEAYRGEIIKAGLCSKCGSTVPPSVSTEEREFEFSAGVEKAAEYTKRLLAGEDPADLEKELMGSDPEVFSAIFMSVIRGEFIRIKTGWPDEKAETQPVVY